MKSRFDGVNYQRLTSTWLVLLFVLLWLLTAIFFVLKTDRWHIDTDLTDVTPRTLDAPGTAAATAALRANIESRILLLISSDDEVALDDAEVWLRDALESLPTISLHDTSDELYKRLTTELLPYRFNFLSGEQKQRLLKQSPQQLAEAARRQMQSLMATPRLFTFQQDPLGWHSEALLDLLGEQAVDDGSRLIGLSIKGGAMEMNAQAQLSAQLSQFLRQAESDFKVRTDTSGVFFFAADAAAAAKKDVTLISSVSSIGVVLLLLLAFTSFRALLLPVLSVLSGVGFAVLFTHAVFGSLHILTIVFGASLIGIAIDYALHFLVHQSHNKHAQLDTKLIRALGLSLTTSLVGYAALGLAGLPALQKVAVFSCSGLLMAWLTVVISGRWFTPPRLKERSLLSECSSALAGLLQFIPARYWKVAVIVMTLVATLLTGQQSMFSDDPRVFFNADAELLASERRVAAVASDFEPGRYIAIVGNSSAQVYSRLQKLNAGIANQGVYNPDDLSGIPLWLPSAEEQINNHAHLARVYETGGAADQLSVALSADVAVTEPSRQDYRAAQGRVLEPPQLQELFGQALPPSWFENEAEQVVAFILVRKGIDTDQLSEVTASLEGVEYVNTLQRTRQALGEQRHAAGRYLLLSLTLIALILLLRYRSFASLRQLLVPVGSIAGFFLICAVSGVQINLFHAMALFLVLGFGMDYAIFSHEMEHQLDVTLQAILLSALTSLLSFGLLALSDIPVVSSFGFTLLVGNSFNLVGAIILARSTRNNL